MSRPRQNGFTLLEILVALVVFGLLMAGLSQTVRYGLSAWSASQRNTAGPEELAVTDAALRRLIEQAAPLPFIGATDQAAFTTTLPEGSGLRDRLADVALLVEPGKGLVLRWAAHADGVALQPGLPPHATSVLAGVVAVRFSYLVAQAQGAPVWVDSNKGGNLPLLVRIGFSLRGKRVWPDVVAAPAAAGP